MPRGLYNNFGTILIIAVATVSFVCLAVIAHGGLSEKRSRACVPPKVVNLTRSVKDEPPSDLQARLAGIRSRRVRESRKQREAEEARCPLHRLDVTMRYVPGQDGTLTEEEWLRSACWEQARFRNPYPCRFSDTYRELHGLPKDGGL